MSGFQTPLDIANRTCTILGVRSIGSRGFNEDSVQASEIGPVFDKMRKIELHRNLWRCSIRSTVLKPCAATSRFLQPVLWSSTTTYFYGSLVSDVTGAIWYSRLPDNLGRAPGYDASAWELYTGPLAILPYDTTGQTTYWAGEVVYTYPGDGTYAVYQSLVSNNSDVPSVADVYDPTVTYHVDDVVSFNSVNYQSLVDLNLAQEPDTHAGAWTPTITAGVGSFNWRPVTAALARMDVLYPIGTGPLTDTLTRNYIRLPANYLRQAPQDPKAGSFSYLGAPSFLSYSDFEYDGDFIITTQTSAILRFGADLADVSKMDPAFCEGLALRIGIATGFRITQNEGTIQEVEKQYNKFMTEARLTNAIEQGAVEDPLDDWISCRV